MPSRPPLPEKHANQRIKHLDAASLPPVKYQILTCQGQDILVGRMKIATPTTSGHAFILRRFDTGAISLTTMFRAAFPEASEQEERRETSYVKDNFDLAGNNGSTKDTNIVRLAGTWVSPNVALTLAEAYHLAHIIRIIAEAKPDPNATYRRSGKGANTPKDSPLKDTHKTPPTMSRSLPTPSSTAATPSAAKRRKESSPAPSPTKEPEPESASSAPARRSTRMKSKSPAPSSALSPSVKKTGRPPKTPKITKTVSRKVTTVTPGGSDETAVDEDMETAEAMGEDMFKQDVAEQKELIANLKAQRNAAMETGEDTAPLAKRARDDGESEHLNQLNFKEPEVEERAIASNRRVSRFHLEPRQKSFAWGVAAFAFGLGAVAFLPNFL